jgi:type IV pilus assembly protein PilY1
MLFSIIGGTGSYSNLGQTWSQPVVADVKIGNEVKTVLVFGGGYDECYENATCGSTQQGNQVYIVDAVTGELYWWASSSGSPSTTVSAMKYSMPSQPKVLDINSDGLVDTIYIGDLGGQLFRVDINNGEPKTNLIKRVKLVAQLGSSGVSSPAASDDRRIYEPPTVALFRDNTLNRIFAAVAVGTGNRSHPLNTAISERYATIFDYDITRTDLLTVADTGLQKTLKYSDMKLLDLSVSTSTGVPTYTVSGGVNTPNTYGWYVNLIGTGEKSLSTGIIFLNRLLFTTYSPVSPGGDTCSAVVGATNLYEMCMPYGTQCSATTPRRIESHIAGLGSEPQVVIQQDPTAPVDGVPVNKLGILIKTKLTEEQSLGKKVYTPLHRWREKTRYPTK